MKTIFKNVKIVQPIGIIEDGILIAEDGIITYCGRASEPELAEKLRIMEAGSQMNPASAAASGLPINPAPAAGGVPAATPYEIVDGEGLYLAPGLVDIHTHAAQSKDYTDDPVACAQHHLSHGITSVCPAIYFSFDADGYVEAINLIKEASKKPECRNIAGIYLEGPFLNPKYGASKELNPWKTVNPAQYMKVIEAARGFARVYCIAPEREGILQYVRDVKKMVPDAVFAVAHSEASPEQVEEMIPYGLKIGTHFSDATGKVNPWPDPEIVGVGPDEVVLMHDDMYAELIVDNCGVHVAPYLIKLVRKVKGDDHIILISDATSSDGPRPEAYKDCFDLFFDDTGELSGSNLTLDQACRNMMKHTGVGVKEVFKYASTNPARAVGFDDRGEIATGKRADLLLVDDNINVRQVYLGGERVR